MNSPQLPSDSLPVRPGDVLADKYRVERVLGTGGMGFVVAARNINLGKLVALKMMLPAALAMPRAVERFEREARAAVQLKSEHIAEVLDIGRLPTGEPYIVMELLDGSDFEGLLQRDRWLQVDDAVDYLLQACEAVAEAHALGVVHRDLKPKNLFLSHRLDGTPIVKVLDFGISKWTTPDSDSHSLTRTSDVFGSPNYMSPEQIRSVKDVDGRTDIWSLGVILFELLTGRVPFLAESLPQLCALVLEQAPPSVASLRADVPPGLVAVVARCLEKSSERRFQTVRELVAALEPFGRPRPPQRASTTGNTGNPLSPGASTLAISSAPAGRPSSPSAGGADVSNGTSTSWVETAPAAKRGRHRLLGALLSPIVLLAVGTALWFGARGTLARPSQHDAAAAATSSVTASLRTSEPPPASVALPSASPSASVTPEPRPSSVTRPVPLPAAPPPSALTRLLAAADAGPARTAPSTSTPPASDPFTPIDRK